MDKPHEQSCTTCCWHTQTDESDYAGGRWYVHLCWREAGDPDRRATVANAEARIPACEDHYCAK